VYGWTYTLKKLCVSAATLGITCCKLEAIDIIPEGHIIKLFAKTYEFYGS
jgi:hypothetical protein